MTNRTSTVVAELAPIGVQLWPTRSPDYAANYTLASVTRHAHHVTWTYESGTTRRFPIGTEVVVRTTTTTTAREDRCRHLFTPDNVCGMPWQHTGPHGAWLTTTTREDR